jgi:hypothetical protein
MCYGLWVNLIQRAEPQHVELRRLIARKRLVSTLANRTVLSWFQVFAFHKRILCRYSSEATRRTHVVGLCTLNQVDP